MDFLSSLHLDGELPEQQTRISHLGEKLAEDDDLRLGFNACCVCAKRSPQVECRGCHRVKYCSSECREKDANLVAVSLEEEDDQAMGHTSVVCALLRLCQADEDAEEHTASVDEAAQDRVRSECESYPATLANVLLDGPCFKVTLARCVYSSEKELVIHVVGASVDAEMWGREDNLSEAWDAYADALQELAETNVLKVIRLCMIGPDCPRNAVNVERRIPFTRKEGSFCRLVISTYKKKYSSVLFEQEKSLPKPDVVCFFNPGFTCVDYSWDETLACLVNETPFIITTNTEMEAIGDCQFLLERNLLPSLPPVAAAIIGSDLVDENSSVVFGENPFAGSRVRQSGTMANDLFVKIRWLLAGVFGEPVVKDAEGSTAAELERPAKKSKAEQNNKQSNPALI